MRPSTFRRLGASLLLALFIPSCADVPTLPTGDAAVAPIGDRAGAPEVAFPPESGIPALVEHRQTRGDLDVRLYSSSDGRLRQMAARRAGKPAVHMRWHYRGGGGLERVSATLYLPDGRTRELPDVARAAGAASVARVLLPSSGPAVSGAYVSGCWYEWFILLDAILALIYAQLEENWDAVAALTVAVMRATWDLQVCLWRNGGSYRCR